MYFPSIFGSNSDDLTELMSVCSSALLCCENLHAHSYEDQKIKSGEVCQVEKKIKEICKLMDKIELGLDIEFDATLDPSEIIYYKRLMKIFNHAFDNPFPMTPNHEKFNLFAKNAFLEHTVNLIKAVRKEAEDLKNKTKSESKGFVFNMGMSALTSS